MKREFFERRVKKQRELLKSLDDHISKLQIDRKARLAVIDELESILKALPKDEAGGRVLRSGTDVYKAREALRLAGHPLHIKDLLEKMGTVEPTADQRRSLSAQLSAYSNKNEIFTRTARGTFGLISYSLPEPSEAEKVFWYQEHDETAKRDDDLEIPF